MESWISELHDRPFGVREIYSRGGEYLTRYLWKWALVFGLQVASNILISLQPLLLAQNTDPRIADSTGAIFLFCLAFPVAILAGVSVYAVQIQMGHALEGVQLTLWESVKKAFRLIPSIILTNIVLGIVILLVSLPAILVGIMVSMTEYRGMALAAGLALEIPALIISNPFWMLYLYPLLFRDRVGTGVLEYAVRLIRREWRVAILLSLVSLAAGAFSFFDSSLIPMNETLAQILRVIGLPVGFYSYSVLLVYFMNRDFLFNKKDITATVESAPALERPLPAASVKIGDKKCPKCGIWNSGVAEVCDCGYQFPL